MSLTPARARSSRRARLRALVPLTATLLLSGCAGADSPAPAGDGTAHAAAVDTLLAQGLAQLEDGREAEARGTFRAVLAIDAGNVPAHYDLGLIEQRSGHLAAARRAYEAALDLDPAFAPALFNQGILLEQEDLAAAVDLYRRATAADPDMAAAWTRLGFGLLELGEDDEAEDALARGVTLDPAMADVKAPRYR